MAVFGPSCLRRLACRCGIFCGRERENNEYGWPSPCTFCDCLKGASFLLNGSFLSNYLVSNWTLFPACPFVTSSLVSSSLQLESGLRKFTWAKIPGKWGHGVSLSSWEGLRSGQTAPQILRLLLWGYCQPPVSYPPHFLGLDSPSHTYTWGPPLCFFAQMSDHPCPCSSPCLGVLLRGAHWNSSPRPLPPHLTSLKDPQAVGFAFLGWSLIRISPDKTH